MPGPIVYSSADEAVRAVGINTKVVKHPHAPGSAGIKMSVVEIAKRMRDGSTDPLMRELVGEIFHGAGRPTSVRDRTTAILKAWHKHSMYMPDPVAVEFISAARNSWCLDKRGFCFRVADCFPKGTLLLRDDFKLVPVEDIKPGEKIWGLDKWTTVKAKEYKGLLDVDTIFLNNGSAMSLTGDHKVYVARCTVHEDNDDLIFTNHCTCSDDKFVTERVRVSELKPYDILIQPNRISFGKESPDPDRAYVEGLYVSDGWASHNTSFNISGQDGCPKEKQKKEVEAICQRLGIDTTWYRKSIAVRDRDWTMRMHEMGTHARFKHLLSIDLDEAAAATTLRGVMADSGANTNGGGRTFTTTSYELFVQTRVLHRMFGVACGSTYIVDHGGFGENPIWRLFVHAKDRPDGKRDKKLRVRDIQRSMFNGPCWDIETEDHYVYLPEHDVTVSNCDDSTVAVGAALMFAGIPTMIVLQAFNNEPLASHVMLAIQEENQEWYRVDPSNKDFGVGDTFPYTKEWWIDPLEADGFDGGGGGIGRFVGVGAAPIARTYYVHPTLGEYRNVSISIPNVTLTEEQKILIYDAATGQLQIAVAALDRGANDLEAAINQIEGTLKALGKPFDPEPATPIRSTRDFPTNGTWTKRMSEIAHWMLDQAKQFVRVGKEALAGARRILVDKKSEDAYVEAKESDTWRLGTITKAAGGVVLVFMNPLGAVVSGLTSRDGKVLTKEETEKELLGGLAGPPGQQGVGLAPLAVVAIVLGVAAAAVVTSIAGYYIVKDICQSIEVRAKEATNTKLLECVMDGKCSQEFAKQMAEQFSKNRVAEEEARAKTNASDPFSKALENAGSLIGKVVLGGVILGGVVLLAPLAKEAVTGMLEKRRAARGGTQENAAATEAETFIATFQSHLKIGDRQIMARPSDRDVYVNFINLPAGVGGAGGGAEAENNRMSFWVWFGRGLAKVELSNSTLPREYKLRAKTAAPAIIAKYLADFLNKVAREVPPRFTHTGENPIKYDSTVNHRGVAIHVHDFGEGNYCADFAGVLRLLKQWGHPLRGSPTTSVCGNNKHGVISSAKSHVDMMLGRMVAER